MGRDSLTYEEITQIAKVLKFLLNEYEERTHLVPDEYYEMRSDMNILLDKYQ